LNPTQNFYEREKKKKEEEREIRVVEHAKSRFIYSDYTKRGLSHLTARHYFILMMTSLRSRHR
jgi:hypothetical protein